MVQIKAFVNALASMRSHSMAAWMMRYPVLQWMREELLRATLEPILQPSPRRLWWSGLSFFLGNALFAFIWSIWLPQPYENLALRATGSLLGYSLMTRRINHDPSSLLTQSVFTALFWFELPVFFFWMYLCNGGNTVWLASVTAMILIYYAVTDWRLATLGLISGGIAAWFLFHLIGPEAPVISDAQWTINAVVIAFSWTSALIVNLSSANLRREQLSHTLTTIGIMAHELRTPLSTVALIGDAIQLEVKRPPEHPSALQLDKLALRLHTLVRNMNHQIDTQIANAKLLQLPRYNELVSARQLVTDVVSNYPYQSTRHRESIRAIVHQDFSFRSSARQFPQVLDNLIKNALYSLTAANSKMANGALRIEVGVARGMGYISVADQGMGVDAAVLPKIFKPFFSSDHATGHGLGLAFCEKVVTSAGGTVRVKSEFAVGAIFTIELPIADSGQGRPAEFTAEPPLD